MNLSQASTSRASKSSNPVSNKTHARSASHGGILLASTPSSMAISSASRSGNSNWMGGQMQARPSALKKPGHQRAFSQGQVVDVQGSSNQAVTGHNRVGSKTDFILPSSHREDVPRLITASKLPSFKGHSRQASR